MGLVCLPTFTIKKSTRSIGKYIIHGSYGHAEARFVGWVISRTRTPGIPNSNLCHPRIGLLLWSYSSKRGVIWRWKNSEVDELECFIMEVFLSKICKLHPVFLVETNCRWWFQVCSCRISTPKKWGRNDPMRLAHIYSKVWLNNQLTVTSKQLGFGGIRTSHDIPPWCGHTMQFVASASSVDHIRYFLQLLIWSV